MDSRVRKVVIAEDKKQEAFKLRQIVESAGARTIQMFENGRDLIKWVEAHPKESDLILLDLVMPQLDGYAVIHELREKKLAVRVAPVTVENSRGVIEALLKLGASEYIIKPFDRDTVITKVRNALAKPPPAW